ncbi:MAG: hypothetical protein HZA35_03160 [Parcubacteria group bacterium]|nr:hypothetical protein [Parcubacteria group bacterium]
MKETISIKQREAENMMRTGDQIRFVTDILRKQIDLGRQIETRANIIIAISGATLTFSLNSLRSGNSPEIFSMAITAALAILFSLMALKPPKILSTKHQRQSVFYHTAIASKTSEEYIDTLKKASESLDDVLSQYGLEIYNVTKYSVLYKKRFAHLAITVLTLGFVVSLFLVLFRFF